MERHTLTKKYLMSLREGLFLVSNVFPHNPMQSRFAEKVTPIKQRNGQWQKIKDCDVHGRLCYVFENEAEYKEWLTDVNYNISKNKKRELH